MYAVPVTASSNAMIVYRGRVHALLILLAKSWRTRRLKTLRLDYRESWVIEKNHIKDTVDHRPIILPEPRDMLEERLIRAAQGAIKNHEKCLRGC